MLSKKEIQLVKSLKHKKNRFLNGLFVIEGEKILKDFLRSHWIIEKIYSIKDWSHDLDLDVSVVSQKDLERLSFLTTPNKVLALVQIPKEKINKYGKLVLALDNIQDPGNLGAMIRLADWFGISNVICSKDSVDIYNPKVIQSSMGSIVNVEVSYLDLKEEIIKLSDYEVLASVIDGSNFDKLNNLDKMILLMGNESRGISKDLLSICQHRITIPKLGKSSIDSLNVTTACAIMLSKFSY